MSDIKYTELDFEQIKNNLKNFLKQQDQFKDYNFDGSSMSVLLDVLAYNTAYNGFYLNMLASEMFLDSASMRESVVSRAKHLGYTPRSARCLSAKVDVVLDFLSGVTAPLNMLVDSSKEFYTSVNDIRYSFFPKNSVYFKQVDVSKYIAYGVDLLEGKKFTYSWVVDKTAAIKQRYIIPNKNVDTTTLKVSVQNSSTNFGTTVFNLFDDINLLSPNDTVYFLQETSDNKYELVFGDGVLGKSLVNGNIINIEYIVPTGDQALGAKTFRINSPGNSYLGGVMSINVIKPAGGQAAYAPQESIESIKLLAPRSYETQNRAVTKSDYETLLKRDIPAIEHIRVWGGEDNDPPMYGKVFCAIKPVTGYGLNEDDRKNIVDNYIKPRNLISVEVILLEPEYIRMTVNTRVNYFPHKTAKSINDIKNSVYESVKKYKNSSLVGFDSDFRYSKLLNVIDSTDSSIESNLTDIKIKYRLNPAFDVQNSFKVVLNNAIDKGDFKNSVSAINSTEFFYVNKKVMLADDGAGTLFLYYLFNDKKIVINPNVGSVNYETGEILIKDLLVTNIPNQQKYVDLYITPKENDIVVLRNQVLLLDDEDINVDVIDLSRVKLS